MSNDVYELIENYVLENPNLNYSELATCMLEDGVSNLSHRSLRLYIQKVKSKMANKNNAQDDKLLEFDFANGAQSEDAPFEDLTPAMPDDVLAEDAAADLDVITKRTPKVLFFDIETSPIVALTWGIGKTVISHTQIEERSFILGWAAQWLNDTKIISDFVTPQEALDKDHERIVKSLYSLVNSADIVIAHNGAEFDMKRLQGAIADLDLLPLSPTRIIDTYKVCKEKFKYESLKLDDLGKRWFGIQKFSTGMDLWIRCMAGDQVSLDYMREYCKQDIKLLAMVYDKVAPYIKNPPSMAVLYSDEYSICPHCGGSDFDPIDKLYVTQQNAFTMVRCTSCGAVSRTKESVINTAKRKNLLIPCAH